MPTATSFNPDVHICTARPKGKLLASKHHLQCERARRWLKRGEKVEHTHTKRAVGSQGRLARWHKPLLMVVILKACNRSRT